MEKENALVVHEKKMKKKYNHPYRVARRIQALIEYRMKMNLNTDVALEKAIQVEELEYNMRNRKY